MEQPRGPFQVFYIGVGGKHIMRKEHVTLISAFRHVINLGEADYGLFAYVIDKDTGLVATGEEATDKLVWKKRENIKALVVESD